MRKILWAWMACAMLVALGVAAQPASAESIFVTYNTTTPVVGGFDWNYSLVLDSLEKIDSSTFCTTTGVTGCSFASILRLQGVSVGDVHPLSPRYLWIRVLPVERADPNLPESH
jgi:hypothetical protein